MSADTRKTVQEYIDETPVWPDGTLLANTVMTGMQWRIWMLATAGKFFEGMVVFMTGVALPLISIEFDLTPADKGLTGAASLAGILIGATALGGLADRFGRKQMFIAEMILFTAFLIAVTVSPNFPFLVVCLFGMGLALGCDYPTAHMVISESIPSNCRGQLVLSAFGFQAVGALFGTVVGFLILRTSGAISDWRIMYITAIIPAVLVTGGRFFVAQSSQWLVAKGRVAEAEKELAKLLRRNPTYPKTFRLRDPEETTPGPKEKTHFISLFTKKKRRRATILASVPWFLQDLGTYGIGIFTPIILTAAVGVKLNPDSRNLAEVIHHSMKAAQGAAIIDVLLIVGIVAAVLLVDRIGRIRLQVIGFIGCAIGLFIAALSTYFPEGSIKMFLIFSGFMVFNFMTNLGPNAMTYLLAGEVFPTKVRGIGAGFAASFGKIGAVLTAFYFPIMLKDVGTATLLYILVGTSLLGALVTACFSIETNGVNLEKVADTD